MCVVYVYVVLVMFYVVLTVTGVCFVFRVSDHHTNTKSILAFSLVAAWFSKKEEEVSKLWL